MAPMFQKNANPGVKKSSLNMKTHPKYMELARKSLDIFSKIKMYD